ncbi:MAG: response regulator transcription factor [Campylobacterota bacterium]
MDKKNKDILKLSSALIVEDNISFRQKFKSTLEIYFDTVYEASNGDEGIDIYQAKKPSVIFTDIKMPKMSGTTFTSFIRKFDKKVPIIALSAYSEKQTLRELISMNLIDFLEKPVEHETLKSILYKVALSLEENGFVDYNLNKNLTYSFSYKVLYKNKKEIALTPKEILFLELMITNKQHVVTKEMIEDNVYESKSISDSALSNLVFKLRKKIGENIFKTIPSVGYSLVK